MANLFRFTDQDALAAGAGEKIVELANAAIADNGFFRIALAGGSTPKRLYSRLASDGFRSRIDWPKVQFFFGDERNVSPDHEDSNFRMANESLFDQLEISPENIFRWKPEAGNPADIAAEYRQTMEVKCVSKMPRFDLILLGMGSDGHTASLFPGTQALIEKHLAAVANWVEKLNDWRFTITFPVINNAATVMFLVSGEEKAETLRDVIEGEHRPDLLPSQKVILVNGQLLWYADMAAARLLSTN